MVQASDVTVHVRARQEFERREQAIQAQWAELQRVYRGAEDREAEWTGVQEEALSEAEIRGSDAAHEYHTHLPYRQCGASFREYSRNV